MNWKACLEPVTVGPAPGKPPAAFLDTMLPLIKTLPDEVFAKNSRNDIYSVVSGALGPFVDAPGQIQRRAVMLEVLRVDAGFESGWNFLEGRDTSAGMETPSQKETGAWQVSADSMGFDASLGLCVDRHCGGPLHHDVQTFLDGMKKPALAVEYVCRLFRFNTRWSGPSNRGWLARAVSRAAMAEFQAFLQ